MLADPSRARILHLLAISGGELCVCDMALVIGMSVSALSHQLRFLRERRRELVTGHVQRVCADRERRRIGRRVGARDLRHHRGDLGEWRDGRLAIRGRLKDVLVLSNGEKLPPQEVELAILGDGGVSRDSMPSEALSTKRRNVSSDR